MDKHKCAQIVRLLADSPREAERLIEEWVEDEGNFIPPVYISAKIGTDNKTIISLNIKWKWDYELAKSIMVNITIGRAIGLNIQQSKLARRFGVKLNPTTKEELLETIRVLLNEIPELSDNLTITD